MAKNIEQEMTQMEEMLRECTSEFGSNRDRIREIKELLEISRDPEKYQKFKKEMKMQINTLNLKTELARLVMRNERLNKNISTLKVALMQI